MPRRTLQIIALLFLTVLIGVVSLNAQYLTTMGAYHVHIPFDFTVGDNSYQAGEYRIRLTRFTGDNNAVLFIVHNAAGEQVVSTFAMMNGNKSKDDTSRLYFNRYGQDRSTYVLNQVVSPDFGYTVPTSGTATWVNVTQNFRQKAETVAVALTKGK